MYIPGFVLFMQMMESGKIIVILFHTPLPTTKGGGLERTLIFYR